MLEVKNLVKIYKPKKGVPVKALDGVSLNLPDTGMIFLLGKSGSGKSTLLNLLGGLDRYNDGEIIIKGVSSKSFRQQHFDSYRNTYVGFIFQEYNILDEFSVGANIALAIELQGRKATDEEINAILHEVDLEGYGNRKPNELSGGQKQRVAIARALIKNPEIIMADEPTGALDSATGKQVFDTLKKLSADKLVIVVSHDREFSEKYADRIIELSDGRIVSDVQLSGTSDDEKEEATGLTYGDKTISIPMGYQLSEEDRTAINDYLRKTESATDLLVEEHNDSHRRFVPTDNENIRPSKETVFSLIKSKLSLKNAFKIGSSSLKYKKIRLTFTIILSVFAFTLFGVADTCGSYNHIKTCTNSIIDTGLDTAAVKESHKLGSGIDTYWSESGYGLSDAEINTLQESTGLSFTGVYVPEITPDFSGNFNSNQKELQTNYNVYSSVISGFVELTDENLSKYGYRLSAGRLPNGTADEIAVSDYMTTVFQKAGYREIVFGKEPSEEFTPISSASELIGKTLFFMGKQYTVTGIIDTGFDFARYERLLTDAKKQTNTDLVVNYLLVNELEKEREYSLTGLAVVGKGKIAELEEMRVKAIYCRSINMFFRTEQQDAPNLYYVNRFTSLNNLDPMVIHWFDQEQTVLGEREILVSRDMIENQSAMQSKYSTDAVDGVRPDYHDDNTYDLNITNDNDPDNFITESGYKVVGYIEDTQNRYESTDGLTVVPDSLYNRYATDSDSRYDFAMSPMPQGRGEVENLVKFCYAEQNATRFPLQSAVTLELDTVNEVLAVLSKVFLWLGVAFAVFAALMLANFIATSVSHKKQEIGILRAIGSRSNDVFRIFFSESFIIAMINFVLSLTGTTVAVAVANQVLRKESGILVTILNFGPRQVLLLLALCLAVAAVASFVPVKRIASKRPIDAIRGR